MNTPNWTILIIELRWKYHKSTKLQKYVHKIYSRPFQIPTVIIRVLSTEDRVLLISMSIETSVVCISVQFWPKVCPQVFLVKPTQLCLVYYYFRSI